MAGPGEAAASGEALELDAADWGCNIDHTSHSSKAMQEAKVRVRASLRKSVLVHRPCVRKDSCLAVHIIRGTELPISLSARGAAGNTVVVALPGPPYSVAHEMFNVSGTKRILFPDGPTATSNTWLPANRLPLGT